MVGGQFISGAYEMATFRRVIPLGQLAIMRRELEQRGATNIDWTSVGDGHVEVTATISDDDRTRDRVVRYLDRLGPSWW